MNRAIIHISDLHYTFHKNSDGEIINTFDSYLTTLSSEEPSKLFISDFIKNIKQNYRDIKFSMVVSGDIADKGHESEFESANIFLERICNELNINKEDVLIVPGDHDVNWSDCLNAYQKLNNPTDIFAYDLHDEKFMKFKKFYDTFYDSKRTFIPKSPLVNYIKIDVANILIVGFNSNLKVGTKGANGYIDIEKAEQEIESLIKSYPKFTKIAVFHHNIIGNYEDKPQWEESNLIQFRSFLQDKDFRLLLYGNEHTFSSEERNQLLQSSVGSLGKKTTNPSFKIYKIITHEHGVKLSNHLWTTVSQSHKGDYVWGSWNALNNQRTELKDFVLQEARPLTITNDEEVKEIPHSDDEPKQYPVQSDYKGYFLKLIKEKKLFHSGHFHWSETSRAHNWIDISRILNNKDDLHTAKEAIIDVIEKNGLGSQFDFIIGLGIEGNILSTRTSVKYNRPYSFLPYSYRYDEHNDYEKRLNYDNNGTYKSVLIITDVVNDGRTIRKLIHKRAKAFFEGVQRVIVISLFYTGDITPMNIQILNKVGNQNNEDDHQEERINYYFVLDMKVERCPYPGKNYRTECLVMRENLGCVHNFYDEEKAYSKFIKQGQAK